MRKNIVSQKSLRQMVYSLFLSLEEKKYGERTLYVMPEEIDREIKCFGYSDRGFQHLADNIASHTRVSCPVKICVRLDVFQPKERGETETAGLYRVACNGAIRTITIEKKMNFKVEHILAILAHETTHNFLFSYHLRGKDELKNEILTDVTAIFLGFGKWIVDGYASINSATMFHDYQSSLGYIGVEDAIYVLCVAAILNDWDYGCLLSMLNRGNGQQFEYYWNHYKNIENEMKLGIILKNLQVKSRDTQLINLVSKFMGWDNDKTRSVLQDNNSIRLKAKNPIKYEIYHEKFQQGSYI